MPPLYQSLRFNSGKFFPGSFCYCVIGENLVATGAGFFNVTGFQRESQAFRRGVRLVNRNVAPPNPPVIPQVVVGVVIINSKSDFGLGFHLCDLFQ